jgi:molecular chaperone DnaK (HSP70)
MNKCFVRVINNKIICENDENNLIQNLDKKKLTIYENYPYIKNKHKLEYLINLGVQLDKYHPSILKSIIDNGRDHKIPNEIKETQMKEIAMEAGKKGFSPSIYGYNNKLHKNVKIATNHIKRKYNKKVVNKPVIKGGNKLIIKPVNKPVIVLSSSEEEDTDIDEILSDIEDDLKNNKHKNAVKKLNKIKNKIPIEVYKNITQNIHL